MWRQNLRSTTYDTEWGVPGPGSSMLARAPQVSGSTLLLVLLVVLLFMGIIPASVALWFCIGVVCVATCLRLTHPDQIMDASQGPGSFALSLLTAAPRSQAATMLLLPPSHSGLLHLAMMDRDWLSAGGNLLFGSPGRSNRLTEKDLAQLKTHVHDANCKHCSIGMQDAFGCGSSSTGGGSTTVNKNACSNSSIQGGPDQLLLLQQPQQPTAGNCHSMSAGATGGQFCWATGNYSSLGGSSSVAAGSPGQAFFGTAAAAASPSGYESMDWLSPSGSFAAIESYGAASAGSRVSMGGHAGLQQQHQHQQQQHGSILALQPLRSAGAAYVSTGTITAGDEAVDLLGGFDDILTRSSSSMQLPITSSSSCSAGPVAAASSAAAAAASTSARLWPGSAAAAADKLAALTAQQSAFHQSLLKAWSSCTSLDGLDDNTPLCSICLGSFKPGSTITSLPCAHLFHKDCILPWLLQQGRQSTCPLCKAGVFAS